MCLWSEGLGCFGAGDGQARTWDTNDLAALSEELLNRGWEGPAVGELLGEFPVAWDVEGAADVIGTLRWDLDVGVEILLELLDFRRRDPGELAVFSEALRGRHGWQVCHVAELLKALLIPKAKRGRSKAASNLLSIAADLSSALLEGEACWLEEEVNELLGTLMEGEVGPSEADE
ncbi:hypothetical protein CYMTET_8078 [Cymbomonas tetramitiformis]|uniref:Uncharacterized protein n=1 Tax=Cymbomonas tetramitiformis TaxID=36881 RepID=A0AAE0GU97_9CHLO|nr:hypothetical protein CYMTET_8078 [Cymbomonas tetramitiformis]